MRCFEIDNVTIGSSRTFIIAEIGQNHQGSLELAKTLISKAKQSGADCVKFQKSCLSEKFTKSALDALYVSENAWGKTYGEHKQYLEFTIDEYHELRAFSHDIGIMFTASAMDLTSFKQLCELNVPFIKIGSGDANNFPLLTYAASKSVPLIISTGMQCEQTVRRIVAIMRQFDKRNYCLMHCVSAYPTAPENCGLRFIKMYQEWFPDVCIGYSGHEIGVAISIAAILYGAKVIERHFTLDKSQKGSDHKSSLTPVEFAEMVQGIKSIEKDRWTVARASSCEEEISERIIAMKFDYEDVAKALKPVRLKHLLDYEIPCFDKLGKSLVFNNDFEKGHIIGWTDVTTKVCHPKGLPGEEFYNVLGKILSESVQKDSPVSIQSFEEAIKLRSLFH